MDRQEGGQGHGRLSLELKCKFQFLLTPEILSLKKHFNGMNYSPNPSTPLHHS